MIGRTKIGGNTVLRQGTGLVNCDSPGNCNVFRSPDGKPFFKPLKAGG
jgi:serine O-acetyltransferase